MRRRLAALLLSLFLAFPCGAAQAADPAYPAILAGRMMELMWEAMLWFFHGMEEGPLPPPSPWEQPPTLWEAPLDGEWMGLNGERLAVRAGLFRLVSPRGEMSGRLAVAGERALASTEQGIIVFRYRRRGPLLLLQDPAGRVFAFRLVDRSSYPILR